MRPVPHGEVARRAGGETAPDGNGPVERRYAPGMKKTGKFLGVPYDWRPPTVERVKSRWWNPDDSRVFTPKSFGWGYDINFARLLGRRNH